MKHICRFITGLDFKKSVPHSFLELIKSAEQQEREPTKDRTDIMRTFEEAPANCTLVVLDMSEVVLFIWRMGNKNLKACCKRGCRDPRRARWNLQKFIERWRNICGLTSRVVPTKNNVESTVKGCQNFCQRNEMAFRYIKTMHSPTCQINVCIQFPEKIWLHTRCTSAPRKYIFGLHARSLLVHGKNHQAQGHVALVQNLSHLLVQQGQVEGLP